MTTRMKKFLAMVLALTMMLALAACGEKKESSNAIKIGCTAPLTGEYAIYGNAAKGGAEVAVEEINALGGVQFEFRCEDDVCDSEKAVNAYNTLKDWGMQISLGSVTSGCCVSTSAECSADRYFMLTPSASTTDALGGIPNPLTGTVDIPRKDTAFQMCFMDPNQGAASAEYMNKKQLGEKIAVIYKNDCVYSTGVYNSFLAKAEELGLNIVCTNSFTNDSKSDFSVQLQGCMDKNADLVFMPIYHGEASLILTQADAMGYTPTFFGVDGLDGILNEKGFDTALAEGVMLLTPFNSDEDSERTQKFVTTFTEKYGMGPSQFAADAYDCIYAIYEALEGKDVGPETSHEEFCELLVSTFASGEFEFDGLTGDSMTWDETGAVTKEPKGMIIQNGVYVGID